MGELSASQCGLEVFANVMCKNYIVYLIDFGYDKRCLPVLATEIGWCFINPLAVMQ